MRLALLVLIVVLATATSAAAQTGQPLDTVTVGPNVEVFGTHELKAGTTYTAVITGQLTKTFHNAGGVTTDLDGFYCFASNDPRVCQSQENPSETLYASTTGQSGDTTMGSRVEPTHKAPPYRSDHIYTVAVRFTQPGKLRLSTKPQCSVGGTSCSGPGYTVKLYPAEPTKCASGGANAFAALERVDLCSGERTQIRAPADKPVVFLPEPMPNQATALEVFLALLELREEQQRKEEEEFAAAMTIISEDVKKTDDFKGCMLFGDLLLGRTTPKYLRATVLAKACVQMVLAETKMGADDKKRASSAARGCNAVFVPVFPKGRKVTKRMLERARDAERRQIAASCSDRTGKLSISIRARGDKKLPAIIGRRPPVAVMHRAPDATTNGPDRDLTARLRFRKG